MIDRTSALSLLAGLVLGAIVLAAVSAQGAGAPARPVVVELFTSQGCSSCPPADAFVETLAREDGVVALTRPVTYWDQLGWKDTLARQGNTQLQRAYATRGGEGAGVYTPQIMVQGRYGAVGSDRVTTRGLIAKAARMIGPAIAVRDGFVAVAGSKGTGDVMLIALKSSVTVRIGRGENSNRTVRYSNVVVGETRIGRWTGATQSFAIPVSAIKVAGADRYAIIVQSPGYGPVLAGRFL